LQHSCRGVCSAEDKYLYDLNGYLVVRGVLTDKELSAANAAIDSHKNDSKERTGTLRNTPTGTDIAMAGDGSLGRQDLGGCLEWGSQSAVFRSILTHPQLVPYYEALMGTGYRMDHLPLIILQDKGSEGFALHGGRIDHTGSYAPHLAYSFAHGVMHNPLLGVSVQLCDHGPGDGGFVVLKGSHKANLPTPARLMMGKAEFAEHLQQPVTKAGDVVFFSEGTVHGAMAWTAEHQRRVALYRFAPSTCAYARMYHPEWPSSITEGLTEAQRAVLEPPYSVRLDRPAVQHDGSVKALSRPAHKKAFDKAVFGHPYF